MALLRRDDANSNFTASAHQRKQSDQAESRSRQGESGRLRDEGGDGLDGQVRKRTKACSSSKVVKITKNTNRISNCGCSAELYRVAFM